MSVGTIVTIVLLMTVLILGIVLVRTIFTSAKYNIETIDEKVKTEINKLFAEDKRIVVYLANQQATVKQGENWGVAWAVKNVNTGTTDAADLTYEVLVSELGNCAGLSEENALNLLILGKSETTGIPLPPGQTNYEITRLSIPETAPLCTIRYRINTMLDGADYATSFFDVEITA